MRAPAFTLTEMLVVVTIFGLIAGIVAAGAPGLFERAALRQAHTRLLTDLDAGAAYARRNGSFGTLEIGEHAYRLRVGDLTLAQRTFSSDLRLRADPNVVELDAAGRFRAARLILEGSRHALTIQIDPITGRPTRTGHGADGGVGRRRHSRLSRDRLSGRFARRRRRRVPSAPPRASRRVGAVAAGGRQDRMARRTTCGASRRTDLVTRLRALIRASRPAHGPGEMRGQRGAPRRAVANAKRVCDPRRGRAPAMSMMELLVALTVFGLIAGTALSPIGAWMAQGRARVEEARFWRAAAPAQVLLSELAAGAVEGPREIASDRVRLRVFVPRLAPHPIDINLQIHTEDGRSHLVLNAPEVAPSPSIILHASPPLRFSGDHNRLDLEAQHRQGWTPIAVAALPADAPFVCAFDAISRQCR